MFKTLRMRFAVWTALLLLAGFAAFGSFVYFRLRLSLYQGVDEVLRLSATQAMGGINYEDGHIVAADDLSDSAVTSESRGRGITVRLYDAAGALVQSSGPLTAALPSTLSAFGTQPFFATSELNNTEVRSYFVPVLQNNRVVGFVQAAQLLSLVQDTLQRLLVALGLAAPVLAVLAGTGGYFLAARALLPIDRITRTAREMSATGLSIRLNLSPSNDEVGRLASTFDSMLARLDDSFKRERRFAADASHELRTPLTAMQAILSVTREQRRTPEDYERALDDLSSETSRMRGLVEDLLQLARGDASGIFKRSSVDVSQLLCDLCEAKLPLAEQRRLTLTHDVTTALRVSGDMDTLLRVFLNLLDNALKYTKRGGVHVSARQEEAHVVVMVQDTGIGIAPEHLPHIFERFYRVDPSRSESGTGLGLAISHDIILAHGGTVEVSSIVGQGTQFVIKLIA